MNSNRKRILLKILISIIFTAAALLMTSCPPQVTPEMVSMASDILPPTITNISPTAGSNYYSSVTITGNIYDDVLVEGDESGRIASIYYRITNDETRKGKINIGQDDTVVKDESFGTGDITFDLLTGEFEFTFSTMVPNKFRDQITVSITAIDNNDNASTQEVSFRENDGPYVNFDFYSDSTYAEASRITNLNGTEVYIYGSIGNSDYQLNSASEIVNLEWGIFGTFWGGSLDLTEDSEDWVDYLGIYRTLNNDEDYYFDYNPETQTFNTHQSIELDNGMYFYVEATDSYGHVTELQQLLSPPALLTLSRPDVDFAYYSPDNSASITVSSKIIDPNDGSIIVAVNPGDGSVTAADVGSVSYEFLAINPADTATLEAAVATAESGDPDYFTLYDDVADFDTFFDVEGNFSFPVDTSILSGLAGDVNVRIIATDIEDNTIPKKSATLENDSIDPTISSVSFADDNSDGYVRRGDEITLTFTTADADSGVSSASLVSSITGETITGTTIETGSTVDPETGKKTIINYSTSFPVPAGAVSDADGDPLGYSISITDNVGNTASTSAADQITFYSPYSSNSYSGTVDFDSNNNQSGVFYARATSTAYDTISIDFTSTRVLSGNPTATVAGRNAAVNRSGLDYTITLTTNGSEPTAEGAVIPFTITLTDAAGNQDTIDNSDTSGVVYYDDVSPGAPNTPIYGDTYINDTEADSVFMTVNYGGSGAITGDRIQLFRDAATDVLLGEETSIGGSSSSITVDNRSDLGSDGAKSFYARVIDKAGNVGTNSAILSGITLDTQAPTFSIDGNTAYGDSLPFTLSINTSATDIDSYTWGIAGTGSSPNTSGATITTSGTATATLSVSDCTIDGEYTATLNVTDNAGNAGTQSSHVFIYDETEFTLGINGLASTYYGSAISASADISGNECGIQSYAWSADSGYFDFTPDNTASTSIESTSDDSATVTLSVTDNLGRTKNAQVTNVQWETSPPHWTGTTIAADLGSINSTYTFTATATDDASGMHATLPYQWTIDQTDGSNDNITQDSATLTINSTTINSTDGAYKATCVAQDVAGNTLTTGQETVFNWDNTAPVINVTDESPDPSSAEYLMNGDTVVITFTATDDYSPLQEPTATIMGDPATIGGAGPYTATRTISGETSDADGVAATYSISCSDTIDIGTNNSDIYTPSSAPYIFYGAYNESDSGYFYLSSPGISVTSDNYDGTYYWASETDEISVTFTGVRELSGEPTVIIGGQTLPAGDVDYNTGDKTCSATFTVPATALTDGTDPLNEGDSIPVTISVTDAAGNSGSYTYTSTVRYDNTAPAAPGTPTFPGSTVAGYINYTNISGGSISFEVDGITVPTSPSTITTSLYRDSDDTVIATTTSTGDNVSLTITDSAANILAALGGEGAESYYVMSVDSAGNESTASGNFSVTVDTVIDTFEAGDSYSGAESKTTGDTWTQTTADADDVSTPITVAWTFYIGASLTGNVTATDTSVTDVEITACSADAEYTARMTVTDDAGNTNYDTFSFVWDTIGPTGVSVNEGSNLTGSSTLDSASGFSLTAANASDAGSGVDYYTWDVTLPSGATTPSTTTNLQYQTLNIDNGGTADIHLAEDGSDDGNFTATLTVYDLIGNSSPTSITFLWDTQSPIISPIPDQGDYLSTPISLNPAAYITDPLSDNTAADPGSGIESYAWEIDGPAPYIDRTVYGSVLTHTLMGLSLGDGTYDGDYSITLTVTDYAGNVSAGDTFTLGWGGDGTKALNSTGPTLLSGGSDSSTAKSTGSSTSGRISTYDFDEAEIGTNELSTANTATVGYNRRASSGYSGSLYSSPSKAEASEASSTAVAVAVESDNAVTAETVETSVNDTSDTEIADILITPAADSNRSRTAIRPAGSKASSAAVASNTVSETINETLPAGNSSRLIWLLLIIPAAGALVLLRKRRQ